MSPRDLPLREKVVEGAANRVQVVPKKKRLQTRALSAEPTPEPVAPARAAERTPNPVPIRINPVPVVPDKAVEAVTNSAVGAIRPLQINEGNLTYQPEVIGCKVALIFPLSG